MKYKHIALSGIALLGLSTTTMAADLGVLTSLDVCDALGLSGLTISSETNCLQISGGVSYEFNWGDYRGAYQWADTELGPPPTTPISTLYPNGPDGANLDWESRVEAWLRLVGTADSDFGPAKANIKLRQIQYPRVQNQAPDTDGLFATDSVEINEAYVSIGDDTVIMAGRKSSIANFDDDVPYNFLGLANSSGVLFGGVTYAAPVPTGNHVIQVVSDLGNGVSVGAGLENLADDTPEEAGTLVGVVQYRGENISAHVTGLAGGVLDGTIETYALHAGFTGTFDIFRVRAAVAADSEGFWNALATAQATFDIFEIALSAEAATDRDLAGPGPADDTLTGDIDWGVGGSIGATISDGVAIKLGGRYYSDAFSDVDGYQIAAQLVADVTENLTATAEIGVYGTDNPTLPETDFYGAAELAWAPGGGFTSSLKGEAHQTGAYRVTFKAAKSFE